MDGYILRGDILIFDDIMYRDQFIEVTLSVPVLDSYYPSSWELKLFLSKSLSACGAISTLIFLRHAGQVRGGRAVAVARLASGVFAEFGPVSVLRTRAS